MNVTMWDFRWSNDHLMRLKNEKNIIICWKLERWVCGFYVLKLSSSSFYFDIFINNREDHCSSMRILSNHFPTIKSTSAKNRFQEVLFSMNEILYKNVLTRTIGFVWKILQTLYKKRRKIETSNYFAKINESNLRLLIYKLRLNNIILQAINHVMSKENRFL